MLPTKPLGESNTAIRLRTSLENVRSYLVDLEALAHAAREPPDGNDGGDGGPEEPPVDDEDGDDDGGPAEPSGSSGNGEPKVTGSGDLPQVQAQHGLVEVIVDNIDDGAGEPPGLIGRGAPGAPCMRRTRRSRGGIMLDVAAGPPELVPLVPAGSARVAFRPTASA